jgi:hypothetical protein
MNYVIVPLRAPLQCAHHRKNIIGFVECGSDDGKLSPNVKSGGSSIQEAIYAGQ